MVLWCITVPQHNCFMILKKKSLWVKGVKGCLLNLLKIKGDGHRRKPAELGRKLKATPRHFCDPGGIWIRVRSHSSNFRQNVPRKKLGHSALRHGHR